MARSCRPEWLWACRGELHEAPHGRPHANGNLGRHAGGLVGSVRAGAESRGGVRMARFEVHPRGPRWLAANRVSASPADHLEQGAYRADANALLVPARALLVRPKEECAVVRQAR